MPKQHSNYTISSEVNVSTSTFCIIPWISMMVRPEGSVFPCCRAELKKEFGNLNSNSLHEIWNGADLKDLRKAMLNNEMPSICLGCYETEKLGGTSFRSQANLIYQDHLPRREATEVDGSLLSNNPKFLDLRFSNTCNLKCRSCDHTNSSSWYSDSLQIYGDIGQRKNVLLTKNSHDIFSQLTELLPDLTHVYFAGGEPLLDRHHYQFLKLLLENKKNHLHLSYNSNLTQLNFGEYRALEMWKHFKSVRVGVSLDGVNEHTAYLRHGTTWEQIKTNLLALKSASANISVMITPTVGVLNCFHVPELIETLIDLDLISHPDNFEINLLHKPESLNLAILNAEEKLFLKAKFQQFLVKIEPRVSVKVFDHLTSQLNFLLNFADSKNLQSFRPHFRKYAITLDHLRKEKTLLLAPELFDLLYSG